MATNRIEKEEKKNSMEKYIMRRVTYHQRKAESTSSCNQSLLLLIQADNFIPVLLIYIHIYTYIQYGVINQDVTSAVTPP